LLVAMPSEQFATDRLGRGHVSKGERVDDVDASAASAVGECSTQCGGDHLLGGALRVVTRRRPVDDATTGHLGGADRALTSATGSLLLERLATCTGDLAAALGLVRTLASRSALRDDDLVDERDVGLTSKVSAGRSTEPTFLPFASMTSIAVAMELGPLHCVANENDAAASAGNGALDEQQALLERRPPEP
jgi:hypothetical protein